MKQLMPVFLIGGLIYAALELLWRGRTHWTMLICGGLCFTLMYLISALNTSVAAKLLLSTAAICTVEYLTGCLVNLRLGLQVWDYSKLPFNIHGQVCPQFALMWLLLSIPGLALCRWLRWLFQ